MYVVFFRWLKNHGFSLAVRCLAGAAKRWYAPEFAGLHGGDECLRLLVSISSHVKFLVPQKYSEKTCPKASCYRSPICFFCEAWIWNSWKRNLGVVRRVIYNLSSLSPHEHAGVVQYSCG